MCNDYDEMQKRIFGTHLNFGESFRHSLKSILQDILFDENESIYFPYRNNELVKISIFNE